MSSRYSTCVRHDGFLYGVDGRQDVRSAPAATLFRSAGGKIRWTKERFGVSSLILADGKLVINQG